MIVNDGEIQKLIRQENNPLLTDYDEPKDWRSKDSLVQPCSIDLHIGEIYQPGVKSGKPGSAGHPKTELVLRTGQTAVVATRESIHLEANYAGFGFPPSHVSAKALLMTNPGHVDPGYNGRLRFTVINMGREDYVLRHKDVIVTMLIFKLDVGADASYSQRNPRSAAPAIDQADIDILSPDFVDVEKRASAIARRTLVSATAAATVLAAIVGWGSNWMAQQSEGIDDLKTRLTRVEVANANLAKELQAAKEQFEKKFDLDHRLATLESQNKSRGASK